MERFIFRRSLASASVGRFWSVMSQEYGGRCQSKDRLVILICRELAGVACSFFSFSVLWLASQRTFPSTGMRNLYYQRAQILVPVCAPTQKPINVYRW